MPKKDSHQEQFASALTRSELTEVLGELIQHIDKRFDAVATKVDLGLLRQDVGTVIEQLERVELRVTGLSGRVDVLEDVVKVIKSKLAIK